MGVERTVPLPPGAALSWTAVAERLAARSVAVKLMMIDGLPAFPDEEPPADWRELRVGTPAGMVTLRRTDAGLSCVVWGNASAEVQRTSDEILRAAAEVSGDDK